MTHYAIVRDFDPNHTSMDYAKEELIFAVTKDLVKRIADGELYTVRLIQSKPTTRQNYYDTIVELRFDYEVSRVQYETFKMSKIEKYEDLSWGDLSISALDEIKKRIKNKWKSFWSKKK